MTKLKLTLLALACLVASGCINVPKTIAAATKDPSTASIEFTGYGVIFRWSRTNPGTNTLAHSIGKDGTVTVTK